MTRTTGVAVERVEIRQTPDLEGRVALALHDQGDTYFLELTVTLYRKQGGRRTPVGVLYNSLAGVESLYPQYTPLLPWLGAPVSKRDGTFRRLLLDAGVGAFSP